MMDEDDHRCKVCNGLISYQDYHKTQMCKSCQDFQMRSTERMQR